MIRPSVACAGASFVPRKRVGRSLGGAVERSVRFYDQIAEMLCAGFFKDQRVGSRNCAGRPVSYHRPIGIVTAQSFSRRDVLSQFQPTIGAHDDFPYCPQVFSFFETFVFAEQNCASERGLAPQK